MDIKTIIGEDGEEYINAKDLTIAMKKYASVTNPTLSVQHFIRRFIFELITARR